MKKLLLFMLVLSFQMVAFSDCGEQKELFSDKTYITLQNLHLSDEGIFVLANNNDWEQVEALFFDANGFYIERGQPNPELWYCSKCRTYHSCQENCPNGKSRPSKCDD